MFAQVIVDIATSNVDKIFDYRLNEPISVGSRVLVPFGNRRIEGYIISVSETTSYDEAKVKDVICAVDEMPVITEELLKLAKFMSARFYIGYADCFRLFLPPELRSGKAKDIFKPICVIENREKAEEYLNSLSKQAKKQAELIEFLLGTTEGVSQAELNKKYSASALKRLKEENIVTIRLEQIKRSPYKETDDSADKKITLTPLQTKVVDAIKNNPNSSFLLHGITGSGKTEVYMNVIEDTIKNGKTAIMLVPEISLTPQVLFNFRKRFGDSVALLHSGLSAGERFDEWKRILLGEAKIVVGARSAIFCPISNLGVIVIDEEHEQTYNSESHPRYVTSEIAEERRRLNNCTLILGSATPSMVSYHKAVTGEYKLLEMLERVNGKKMPPINIVDMGREIRLGNPDIFSNALKSELEKCINSGNQAILFINRRAFASFVQCKECGWVAKCPDCDVTLALHKAENALKCHYCGNRFKVFSECPECGSDNIKFGSIGTEKVVDELKKLFPNVNILRMDNDTTRTKNAHLNILTKFKNKEAQILVGTQMVAKGHDFPSVTLVGILEPDLSLYHSSYLSAEKTFALVTQVAGRAGRADKQGTIILQTYSPNHYVYKMASSYDYLAFYRKEINIREVTKFPPFSVIVRILFTSSDEQLAISELKEYYNRVQSLKETYGDDAFIYLGRMKSPVNRIMKKYRFQIIMRLMVSKSDAVIKELFKIDKELKNKNVQTFIEVNAQDLR